MRTRLLLLCACVGTTAETLDNLSMEKALIAAYHISFDAMVPRVHAMSLEGTLLQQSSNDKAVHPHYITLKKNLHEFEHDSEQRRSLRDEDHRFLTKKAKYLEACIRAKCTKGQQCSNVGTCQACKIGTFAAADFVLQCAKCPAGTHGTEAVDKDAQEACKPCPVGFYTDFTRTRKDRPSAPLVPQARSKTRRGPPHVSTQVCLSTWSCATTRISFPRAQKTSTRRRRPSLEMEQIALRINVRVVDCHSQKRSHCVLVWCLVPCLLPGAYGPAAVTRIRAAHSAAVTACASAPVLFSLAAHRTATAQSPPPGRWASSSRAW